MGYFNKSNSNDKKSSQIPIGKISDIFSKEFDSTTRSDSYRMGYKEKQAYKEELFRRYGDNLDKKSELEKEIKRLKNLESASRRVYDYRGADEYRDKIKLIDSLIKE